MTFSYTIRLVVFVSPIVLALAAAYVQWAAVHQRAV